MSSLAVIEPKADYDRKNEAAFREEVRKLGGNAFDRRSDLVVPFPKRLAFTSAQGQVIYFGYNVDGNFTIQQDAETPFGLASLSYVSTVQSDLESSFASLETSLTADFDTLSASFTTIATAFADIETAFALLEVDVEAANDAAAAAATSALAAYASETAAGSSAAAAATSATSAATQASNAATSATQASTSETNAAGSAATATTQASNAATSATNASNSASAASTSASTASTQATNASNSASAANTSATNAATQASNAATSASAASSSAGAASTSASQASTSESNAAGSASAAATSATNAATSATSAGNSASAASTSASTASTHATNAGTSASNAATSASDAATSASAAGSSASAASTSASSASTSASNAATSASAAQSTLVAAKVTAAAIFPSTFERDGEFFTSSGDFNPTSDLTGTFSDVSVEGRALSRTGGQAAAQKGRLQVRSGRTYSVTARLRIQTDATNGYNPQPLVGLVAYTADGTYLGGTYWTAGFVTKSAADGWMTLGGSVTAATIMASTPTAAFVRAYCEPCWNGSGTSDAVGQITQLNFADVTESTAAASSASASASSASSAAASQSAAASSASAASTSATNAATQASNAATSATNASTSETNAAGSASSASTSATNAAASQSAAAGSATAASGSASTASTQAGNAGTSATAAAGSATAAATSASGASTSASTASTQASNASASASSASASAALSATYASGSQGSINSSATFADNANATGVPTNWLAWDGGTITRVTGIAPQPYALKIESGAGANAGIRQELLGRISAGWHVIEADVTLVSGALTGAGVHFNWDGGSVNLVFSTDLDVSGSAPGAGTTGRLYKFRKLVQVTAGSTYNLIYAMSHWTGHGSIASANEITWHRLAIRAASQAEIEARQATTDLVTANATISSHTSSIASNTSAISTLNTTVSANYTALRSGGTAEALPSTFDKDDLYWNVNSGGTFESVSTIGRVFRVTTIGHYARSRQRITLRPNRTYRFTARYGVQVNSTSGDNPKPLAGFTTYNSAGTNVSAIWVGSFVSRTTADGWVTVTGEYSTATILGVDSTAVEIDAFCQPNWHDTGSPNATIDVQFVELKDVTDIVATNAQVTTNASAIATVDGKLSASYALTVDSNGRIASMKLLSNGTTSSVKFTASTFSIYDGSSDVAMFEVSGGAAYVAGSKVRTESMTANSVSSGVADETDAAQLFDQTWTTIASVSVTTPDANSLIYLPYSAYIESVGFDATLAEARILRGATNIYQTFICGEPPTLDFETPVDGSVHYAPTFNGQVAGFDTDAPGAAGTYTYYLQVRTNGTGSNAYRYWSATNRRLFALLFKR